MVSKIIFWLISLNLFLFAISINDMTKFELMQVNGIGAKKADAIIKYRDEHNITNVDDLIKVNGVGPKIIQRIKKYIDDTNKEMNNSSKKSK